MIMKLIFNKTNNKRPLSRYAKILRALRPRSTSTMTRRPSILRPSACLYADLASRSSSNSTNA